MIEFYDKDSGVAVSYAIPGTPGMKASLEDDVVARLGDKVAFFVHHEMIATSGANTVYNVVGMRFGRIVKIDLSGAKPLKHSIIQPIPHYGQDVLTSTSAPSTDGLIASLQLVR